MLTSAVLTKAQVKAETPYVINNNNNSNNNNNNNNNNNVYLFLYLYSAISKNNYPIVFHSKRLSSLKTVHLFVTAHIFCASWV